MKPKGLPAYHVRALQTKYDLPPTSTYDDLLRACRGEGCQVIVRPDLDRPGFCLAGFGWAAILLRAPEVRVLSHELWHFIEYDRAETGVLHFFRPNEARAREFTRLLCGPEPYELPEVEYAAPSAYDPTADLKAILDQWRQENHPRGHPPE